MEVLIIGRTNAAIEVDEDKKYEIFIAWVQSIITWFPGTSSSRESRSTFFSIY